MANYTVSTSAELYDALAVATGGDTIELSAGDYGALDLSASSGFDVTYDSPVTIVSADPNAQAVFSGMSLNGVANLTFENVAFDYSFSAGDPGHISPFSITDSTGITIRNALFDGDVASGVSDVVDGYGYGNGLYIRGSSGVTVEDSEFTTWLRGLVVMESQDVVLTGNEVHSIRSDGMDFVEVHSVLIEGNHIHDFEHAPQSGDHMDMIQFWTSGTDTPSTDIVIRGNILDIGGGDFSQSIFMRNEVVDQGLAGSEMFYQDILIEENVILNGHTHGIMIGETDGLTIRNNTVLSVDGSDPSFHSAPRIHVAETSTNVSVEFNAAAAIQGFEGQADWTVQTNAILQNTDPAADGYYDNVFVDSSVGGAVSDYLVIPDSELETLGIGAQSLYVDQSPESVTPAFDVTASADAPQGLVLDATQTYGPLGQVTSAEAIFNWSFGDGTTGSGQVVEHEYSEPGQYDVTLTIVMPDGSNATTGTTVGVAGNDIVSYNSADGQFYAQEYGVEAALAGTGASSVDDGGDMVVDLGATGTVLEVPRSAIERFFGSDGFDLSMTLQADLAGESWGEVFRLHSSFIVSVTENGDLSFDLFLASGDRVTLTTSGHDINDGAAHDIAIQFDGAGGILEIVVDGDVAASATVYGTTAPVGSWNLAFGNPWGGQNFDGTLSAFDLDAASSDYEVYSGSVEPVDGSSEIEIAPDYDPVTDGGSQPSPDPEPETGTVDDTDPGADGGAVPDSEPNPDEEPYDDTDPDIPTLDKAMQTAPEDSVPVRCAVGLETEGARARASLGEDSFIFKSADVGEEPAGGYVDAAMLAGGEIEGAMDTSKVTVEMWAHYELDGAVNDIWIDDGPDFVFM